MSGRFQVQLLYSRQVMWSQNAQSSVCESYFPSSVAFSQCLKRMATADKKQGTVLVAK